MDGRCVAFGRVTSGLEARRWRRNSRWGLRVGETGVWRGLIESVLESHGTRARVVGTLDRPTFGLATYRRCE